MRNACRTPSECGASNGRKLMQQLADNLWVANGAPVKFPAMAFPTRMTIIRLASGELWLHSPVGYTAQLAAALAPLGEVAHLVAPNRFHHLFLREWLDAYPQAVLYAAPGLPQKRPDLAFFATLDKLPDASNDVADAWPWQTEIEHVLWTGNRIMDEVLFFHAPTRTALLTDLIISFDTAHLPWPGRAFAALEQISAPGGGTPRLIRWTTNAKQHAKAAIEKMLQWRPERLVMCHGPVVEECVDAYLRRQFAWLGVDQAK